VTVVPAEPSEELNKPSQKVESRAVRMETGRQVIENLNRNWDQSLITTLLRRNVHDALEQRLI
jgi:hypothetical protein